MEVSSHEDSASEFCCVGSIFSMKLLGFVSKAIKLLLTELVGQCRNILPLAFSALTCLRSVNTEKTAGNIVLLLTNSEVHTGKYLDRSFEVRTKRSEVNKSFIV